MPSTQSANAPHIFGIRHHGPGSARSVLRALTALVPDVILVEGPPDAASVLPLLAHAEMRPPVALLLYDPDLPRRSVYYPFAEYSPEWQAIHYGLTHEIPVRFMDLPQTHQMAMERVIEEKADEETTAENEDEAETPPAPENARSEREEILRRDPLRLLAEAAGYSDSERWWEHLVEQQPEGQDLFEGITEAMGALREEAPAVRDQLEEAREAYMRQTIRTAQREGFTKIAVVCGAWHAPALAEMPPAKSDKAILDGLPKVKIAATWIPWTNGRLSFASGYGAGVESPGWYHHLWSTPPSHVTARWLTRVAHLLRAQDLDASPASVIEAIRLADCLATMRGRPLPGLPEMNEATQTVLCFGSDLPMKLIERDLIVGEALGAVPPETPAVPLQQDLQKLQKRLRLPAEAGWRDYDLDLRKPSDLERSELLHRLALLGVPWGETSRAHGAKGTFREPWRIQWKPEFEVVLIEKGVWGNTVRDAAAAFASDAAEKAPDLPALTSLLDKILIANLPDAARKLMARLEEAAALASDVGHLMDALPPLASVQRYGDVRGSSLSVVAHVLDGLVARIAVGLPAACASLNDDAANEMADRINATHAAIALLQNDAHAGLWRDTLTRLSLQTNLHGLIAGRSARLLLDSGALTADECARRMGLALSTASDPTLAAAWVEGFLKGSGVILLHDETLWRVLDEWVSSLTPDAFTQLLPLLRRTFATFTPPERRQMGERVRDGAAPSTTHTSLDVEFDRERGEATLPLVRMLLGI
ncbi:hypothetical protein CCAX7_31730 [Capsulimonas corticalis]|uniref:Uncharacterized protein n=1 Tax=Capsulimonas corticalis TaxID=2219043 RepID=A0A402CSD3_9BACT|nr:DUF5682 family protein [Capsulimonas corticalis]BDI31122.1 hypothetical protein CCAX7_31730 [Capsulimonas corticalis]